MAVNLHLQLQLQLQRTKRVIVPKSPKKVVVIDYGALDTLDVLSKGSIVTAMPQPIIQLIYRAI